MILIPSISKRDSIALLSSTSAKDTQKVIMDLSGFKERAAYLEKKTIIRGGVVAQ